MAGTSSGGSDRTRSSIGPGSVIWSFCGYLELVEDAMG